MATLRDLKSAIDEGASVSNGISYACKTDETYHWGTIEHLGVDFTNFDALLAEAEKIHSSTNNWRVLPPIGNLYVSDGTLVIDMGPQDGWDTKRLKEWERWYQAWREQYIAQEMNG